MKTPLLLIVASMILAPGIHSQILYSSTIEAGSRFNFGNGSAGTPKVAFDDVSIPNSLIEKDSITLTRVNVGIRRTPGAPATEVKIYYSPLEGTSNQASPSIKIPPILLGTVSLPVNGFSLVTTTVSAGDGVSPLLKIKADTSNLYPGFQSFFIGTALSNMDPANGLRLTSGPAINQDYIVVYDRDSSTSSYPVKFDNFLATYYLQVFGGPATTLPVTLARFNGTHQRAGNNLLRWTTEAEIANTGFELQRCQDGVQFQTLAFIPSKAIVGNSSSSLNYTYSDENPLPGNNYYRLIQKDKDGHFNLSPALLIKNDIMAGGKLIAVYPNPAKTILNVTIASNVSEPMLVNILDPAGKLVQKRVIELGKGSNNYSINVSRLPRGTYTIKAVGQKNTGSAITRFIKQ